MAVSGRLMSVTLCYIMLIAECGCGWAAQRCSGRASDCEHEFSSGHCRVALVNSAFYPSGIGKLSTNLLTGVKVGCVHLCRVAGNIV